MSSFFSDKNTITLIDTTDDKKLKMRAWLWFTPFSVIMTLSQRLRSEAIRFLRKDGEE